MYQYRTEPYQLPGESMSDYQARMRRLGRTGSVPSVTTDQPLHSIRSLPWLR